MVERSAKSLQIFRVIVVPIFCQKMIVKHIQDYSSVMTVFFKKKFAVFSKNRMRIGKTINASVKQNAFLHFRRIVFILSSSYSVGNEVAKNQTFRRS